MATNNKDYSTFNFDEELKKRKQSNDNSDSSDYGNFDFDDYLKQQNAPKVGEYLDASIHNWVAKNKEILNRYNYRYAGGNNSYRADSDKWLSTVTNYKTELETEASEIKSWLEQYKDYVGEDYYNSVIKTLDGNLEIQGNILSASTEDYKFWSNFKTEDAYKTWLTQQEEEQKQLSFDLTAGQAEIDDIQKAFDEFTKLNLQIVQRETAYAQAGMTNPREMAESDADLQGVVARINELSELYGVDARSGGLKSLLSEKKAYYTLAERAQKAKELASVADVNSQNYDIEFEKYAAQGKSMDNGNIPWEFFGNTVADNPIEALRRYYADSPSVEEDYGAGKIGNEAAFALAMTEDEVDIYNYYLAKEGKDKAEEYLDLIAESVNSRVASGYFSQVEGKPALEYYFGVVAGVDQFASGMKGWFADGYTPASAVQMAGGLVREDLADVGATLPDWLGGEDGTTWGQVGYDFLNTTANMLPSILASAAANYVVPGSGAYVGATLMGASAGGNAKVEMLNLGYTKEQANAYGAMVAVAEGSMEYLLGGITKLGGKLPEGITSAILSKVDNAFARAAIKLGGSMVSEGFEEGLQTVIEPWLKEIATGVDWEAPNIDEILYSSLLGALSAFGLEGAGVVAGEVGTYKSGKQIQKIDGGVERLQKLGQTFSADTVAYKIAGKVNAQTDAYTIGRLLNEVGATISEQNLTEIVNGLTAKGMGTRTANTIARQYQSFLNNEMRMTDEQVKILENLSPLADVLRTNIIGSNTTVYQRTRAYSDLMNLADEVSNRKKGDVSKTETTEKTTSPISIFEQNDVNAEMKRLATEVATGSRMSASERAIKRQVDSASETAADRLGVEGRYTSSDTGATRLKSNKQKVSIVGVDSIEDRVMNLKLNDGSVVRADDIDFSTSDEALVYEAVANMRVNANTAWEILKGYDPKSNQKGAIYAMGALEAYTYGHNGVKVEGMSQDGFSALLSPVQKNTANRLGDIDARAKVDAQQKTIDKAVKSVRDEAKSKHKAIPKRKGEVVFEGKYERLTELQRSQIDVLEPVAKGLGVTFHIFESDENFKYTMPDGAVRSANGWYDPKTGEIWIDLKAGNFGQGTIIFTAAHELTHFIRQWSPAKFKIFADFLFEQYGKKGQDVNQLIQRQIEKAAARNRSISWDEAYEEVIADSCETFLRDSKAAEKIAALREKDVGLANKIKTFLGQMLAKMRKVMADLGLAPETPEGQMVAEMTDSIQKLYDLWTDALADAGTAYSIISMDENTDIIPVESAVMNSYRSLAEAAGFMAVENEDGSRSFLRNGMAVSEVTVEDIEISPIGAFINYSLDKGDIDKAHADRQKEMFADICTMACKTNDFAMAMQFMGSAVFTGMKANADKQYGTTYDFPSICTKTQAVIDAMSARMVKLGRGLNNNEIVQIYREVFASGNPVPCPECYVFSRWIGIGGLLDNIKKYQDYYGKMSTADVAKAYREMHSQVEAFAEEQGISFGKAKGALTSKLTKEYNKLTEKIEKAENQGETVKDADRKRLAELEPMMNTVKAMTWLENVYFADSSLTKVNKNYKVSNEVLFDLNNGEEFATKYPEAWAFRTTQGAGYGKAITPYAEASLGEGILVTNNTTNAIKGKSKGTLTNYFLQQKGSMDADARKALDRARLKQKIQGFIGGQRFQSTSDARYENASDYLLAALEMQAMHGMVQVYTKVDGAVPAFSAWGFSINQSLMPLGGGLDADGNVIDTKVGGMSPKVAIENRNKHESAGTITIGVNDNHIRAMFADVIRDFIIPYHASGGKADVIAEFRRIQDIAEKRNTRVRSTDYSRTQSDKVLSDDVLRWLGKSDAEIEQIHEVREARIAILTRGKVDMDVVRGNRFLTALYDKLYGGEWDGVKLAKSKVESQIFPNEFWDQSVSYEESGKITKDYLEYCEDLGFLHRFSGLVPSNGKLVPINGYDQNGNRVQLTDLAYKYENGQKTDTVEEFYWKVLTDRRMYDNNGNYLAQKVVTLNDTTVDTVTNFAKNNDGRQYNKKVSLETAKQVAEAKLSDRPSLTPEQQKNFDYNKNQTTIGSTLKTLKGSAIKRSTKYGVGKEIGGEIYFHKNYADDIMPPEVLAQAERLLDESHPDFEYNCLKYNPKTGVVAFQEAPDFDTAREPMVGDYISVNTNTGEVKTGHSNYIWHHKWNWVKNDYAGFDVGESWEWSKQWLSTLTEVSDGNGIARWQNQLDRFNLPHDGLKFSERKQEFDSKDTSIKILPATFTKFGLKSTDRVLDWGGGQYDIAKKSVEYGYPGIKFEVVDAFNRTPTHNERVLKEYTENPATVLTINNVLNVIKETDIIEDVIQESKKYLAEGGVCYIKIHEGSAPDAKTGVGKVTSSGWQNNQPAEWYRQFAEKYYRYVERSGDILIASDSPIDKKTLPKVSTETANVMRNRVREIAKTEESQRNVMYSDRVLMGSLFSGGGTLEAGLVYQMLDKEFAVEYNKKIAATYTDNHGKEHMFVGDVRDFNSKDKQNVFYLHASPVCKNFSPASHSGGETTLDITTAQATARVLEEQMPQVFTVENVKRYIGSEAYNIIVNKLNELGYTWDVAVYKASDYGNATKRERMIIRAVKDGELPAKPQKASAITSWGEATRDLWETDLIPSTLVRSKIEAIKNTPQLKGVKLTKLDKPLLIYDTTKSKTVSFAWADELAPTLTTKCGDARIIMPDGRVYAPTPKFMGRIQGLPDDYKYPKAVTNAFKIIGNGIPTQLTKAVMGGVLDSAYEQTHDGQVLYSDRSPSSVSTRSLLANALETTTQNDIEKNKLAQYKSKIELIESEYAKLSEIKKQANEIRFTKGRTADETKRLKALDFEANQIANRINVYDRQLLNLEATTALKNVLQREKKLAYDKAKKEGKAALAKQREREAKTIRTLMDKNAESRKKAIERADKTTMRKKIRKVIKDINHLLNHGNKQRNVKEGMKDTVASALALGEVLFNDDIKNEDIVRLGVDSVTESESILLNEYRDLLDMRDDLTAEIEARYDNGIATEDLLTKVGSVEEKLAKVKNRISTLNGKLSEVFERERARLNRSTIDGLINNLAYEYSKLQQSEDSYIKNAYVEVMHTRLTTLAKSLEGKIVKDMDIYQLAEVYDTFTSVKHMISTANSLFFEERNEELMTFVSNVQGEMYEYADDNPKDPIAVLKNASNKVDAFAWDNLKPVFAFDKLGSETFKKLFWDAIEAEGKYAVMIDEARAFNENLREKHGFAKWDLDTVVKEFTLADGKVFKLTLEDMMSIYAYSRRTNKLGINQSTEHMTEGGFVFDENNEYKPSVKGFFGKFAPKRKHAKLTTTYRIDDTVLKAVKEFFNAKDNADKKAYVEAMQDYMTAMGEKGNEVSRKLFGIDIFTELVYMPLQSSADYLNSNAQALSKTPTQASLKNVGMSKQTTPGANNPIVLRAFDEVWFNHIDQMSKYVALVLPIENLQRVFNNVAKVKGDSDISTQALMESIYGKGARQYFDKYITDLNGGVMNGGYRSPLMEMFGKAKKVAVSASLSVWVQQYFAIVRAMDMIRPDYFAPILRHQDTSVDMSLYEEMRKYAPLAIIKEMGSFDVGSGRSAIGFMDNDRRGFKGKMKAFDEYSNIGAEVMDKLGWMTIWSAVKKEVADKQKLTPGTDEFFAACKKRFTEVIVYTQVYDSVNSRSGLMRSQNDLDKFATSFMGETTVSVNMVDKRLNELGRAIKKKDKKAIGKAAGKLGATLTFVISSIALSSLAKAMIGANRDDEEDEAWLEKWMKHFGSNLVSELNPLGMIPYGRDIVSIWEGWNVDRPDMGLIADVVSSVKKCFDDGITVEEALSLSGDVANAFGVPAKNIVRDVKGIINFGKAIFDDIHPTDMGGAFVEGITGEERTKKESLYTAIIRGDEGKIQAIRETYESDKAYKTAVKSALRENDPRIKKAAKEYNLGNVRSFSGYVEAIASEGHFDRETIESAIRSEQSAFNTKINEAAEAKTEGKDEEYKKIVRELRDSYRGIYSQDDIVNLIKKAQEDQLATEDDEETEEATSIYKASDINLAFESGDTDMALEVIDDLFNTKVENYLAEARKEAEENDKRFNENTARKEAEKKAKSSIRSSMTSYWKPLYKEAYKSGNTAEKERIERILKASGLYGTASEVIKTVREWRTERD